MEDKPKAVKARFKDGPVWRGSYMTTVRGIPVKLRVGEVIGGEEAEDALRQWPSDFERVADSTPAKDVALEQETNRMIKPGAYTRK